MEQHETETNDISPQILVQDFEIIKIRDSTYEGIWKTAGIRAEVNRMTNERNKDIRAELTVHSSRPIGSGLLLQTRIPITSSTSKKSFATDLHSMDGTIESSVWRAMIEQLCASVIVDYRKGSPSERISGTTMDIKTHWLIEPLVELQSPTIIFGEGSAGKSLLAQYISVLCDEGMTHNGITIKEPLKVLYADWETNKLEVENRFSMVRKALGVLEDSDGNLVESNIQYKKCDKPIDDEAEGIQLDIDKHGIDLLVIDSVGMALGGDANDSSVINAFWRKLSQFKVSILALDHPNKAGMMSNRADPTSLNGSQYKVAGVRQLFGLVKSREMAAENKIQVTLVHSKHNNTARQQPMGFEYVFNSIALEDIKRINPDEMGKSDLRVVLSQFDQIKAAVATSAKTAEEVAAHMDKTVLQIRSRLSEMVRRGDLIKIITEDKNTMYGLPKQGTLPESGGDEWTEI